MGIVGGLVVALLVVGAAPEETTAASRRKECRQSCGAAIEACIAQGGKRRKCKNQTLKRCRRQGVAVICASTTTTTTVAGGSTTTGPGGSTTTITTPGGTTTTVPASVHGCSLGNATDLRADPSPDVAFSSYSYSPKCIRIAAGQSITFTGDFSFHPLVGGQNDVSDPQSPIGSTSSGLMKTVAFPAAGTFPFYCDEHVLSFGMTGAVFVDAP
jgi:plastocyanin